MDKATAFLAHCFWVSFFSSFHSIIPLGVASVASLPSTEEVPSFDKGPISFITLRTLPTSLTHPTENQFVINPF